MSQSYVVAPINRPAWAPLLTRLHGQLFSPAWQEDALNAWLEQSFNLALLAHDAHDEPLAFLQAQCLAPQAELLYLGVLPHARRQGLARRLLDAFTSHAQALGCEELLLEVAEDNAAAIALYQAWGAKQVGRRKAYYRRGAISLDALVFRQSLA